MYKATFAKFENSLCCFVEGGFPGGGHAGRRHDHWLLMKEKSLDEDETISVFNLLFRESRDSSTMPDKYIILYREYNNFVNMIFNIMVLFL